MLLKPADDKSSYISTLTELLSRPDVSAKTRADIERDIRFARAGVKAEKDAAYEMDFHFKASQSWLVLHDLRIEVNGRVAQIDHLLMNRLLQCYVVETKSVAEGISVNELGEFTRFINSRPVGMPSPFEQNEKHMAVLRDLFNSKDFSLPTRLGITLRPELFNMVLVSPAARISRRKEGVKLRGELLKLDQFKTWVMSHTEGGSLLKVVSSETLKSIGDQLAAAHKPANLPVASRYGLPDTPPNEQRQVQPPPSQTTPRAAQSTSKPPQSFETPAAPGPSAKTTACESCAAPLSPAEARFCRFNKSKFGGKLLCRACQ